MIGRLADAAMAAAWWGPTATRWLTQSTRSKTPPGASGPNPFSTKFAPRTNTSECVPVPRVDRVVDACRITEHFDPDSLDAITAFNVFHHLPDCEGFRRGAQTVLRPGGRIVLIEPWFTPLGQWFYRAIHHAPSLLDPDDWNIAGVGRLEGANSRLPTSVFRDSDARFARSFPALRVVKREPFHKWLYLAFGGLRLHTHIPRPIARALVAADRAHAARAPPGYASAEAATRGCRPAEIVEMPANNLSVVLGRVEGWRGRRPPGGAGPSKARANPSSRLPFQLVAPSTVSPGCSVSVTTPSCSATSPSP